MNRWILYGAISAGLAAFAPAARAAVVITEFSRGGTAGEFVEITNTGPGPVDLTGWSFNDNSPATGPFPIGSLGTLAVGESAVISELPAADFRTAWSLAPAVKVVAPNDQNLGNGDTLNIYDAGSALITTFTYPGGGLVLDGETWATVPANYGIDNFALWAKSAPGDTLGSFASTAGYFGSPGTAPVPEPAGLAALGVAGLLALRRRRR